MKKRLDEYSRVVIPSSYLKELGIEKGELLNVNLGDDKIELSKAENIKTPLEELKEWLKEIQQEELNINGFTGICTEITIDCILDKIEKLEKR